MFYFEINCSICKQSFQAVEGTEKYKQFKENKKTLLVCEDCSDKIRFEAIMNFMRGSTS